MKSYKDLYEIIEKEISSYNFNGNPDELYKPIDYMMSLGGKRVRPVLLLMSCNLFAEDINNAIPAALAVEVFHNFTLVHDDIMDNAPLRRGKETVFKKWGLAEAILSGDVMMIKAVEIIAKTKGADTLKMIAELNDVACKVCEGQQIDMNFEKRDDVSLQEYIYMITLKTAVLLGAALKLGAIAANANDEDCKNLYEFGKNIGTAFQIQDDILDSFGDGDLTGKQVGGDIVSNKKTILLIQLLNCIKNEDLKLIQKIMHSENNSEKVSEMLNLYGNYKVREFAEDQMKQYLTLAFNHFDKINLPESRKTILRKMAEDLMSREK